MRGRLGWVRPVLCVFGKTFRKICLNIFDDLWLTIRV
jgi:hypothetical protein